MASAGYLGSEFASADEVATAIANQDGSAPPTQSTEEASEKQMNYIKKLCAEKNIDEDEYVIEGMTKKDASESIETLMNIKQTDVPF